MAKRGNAGAALLAKTKTIPAKQAVIAATTNFTEVTGITSGVTVEELELTEDGKYWMVTLGYAEPGMLPAYLAGAKSYKSFKVDAKTGDVLSMKIREI